MPRFTYDPPLPARAASDQPFLQHIQLVEARETIGSATWHLRAGNDAVVQLINLTIAPPHRRKGHAGVLLAEVIQQSRSLCKLRRIRLRNIWIVLEQKSQVIGRSFLTKHGFHHTATISDLLKDQDALVYVKSYD